MLLHALRLFQRIIAMATEDRSYLPRDAVDTGAQRAGAWGDEDRKWWLRGWQRMKPMNDVVESND